MMLLAVVFILFQLTTSRRGRHWNGPVEYPGLRHFNSLPHAEVDGETNNGKGARQNFNSLPHAEVDTEHRFTHKAKDISTHYLTQR